MDSLGDRMKKYEEAARINLPGRLPVIVRVDGKAFHTYTKGLTRPVDHALVDVMNDTAIGLCKAIQGAQMAYVQSDEISILVHNYKTLESSTWFDNQVQKMASISAGYASSIFTSLSFRIWDKKLANSSGSTAGEGSGVLSDVSNIRPAIFDSRVFVVPENDVCNYFLWRQKDAVRNSVQTLARFLYSHKECDKKNCEQLKEMCSAKGRPWDSEPTSFRRGRCIQKQTFFLPDGVSQRSRWTVDNEIPSFSEDRSYINRFFEVPPESEQPDPNEG